jgi:hypothetical protein
MRIRIVKTITASNIDTRLDQFQPGYQYEVSSPLGLLFLAEGWAERVVFEDLARVDPLNEEEHDAEEYSTLSNLQRELCLSSVDAAITADMALDDVIAAVLERRTRGQK